MKLSEKSWNLAIFKPPYPKYCIHEPAVAYVWPYSDFCETSVVAAVAIFVIFRAIYRYFDLLTNLILCTVMLTIRVHTRPAILNADIFYLWTITCTCVRKCCGLESASELTEGVNGSKVKWLNDIDVYIVSLFNDKRKYKMAKIAINHIYLMIKDLICPD